ncbi:hypothetical protein HMPREF1983_01281 [Gemella bergeri ATCC 700627]|uniref:Uncharacterized protein n=1 Tax=Gemella bergeri ATCC 700627 TaxID=1321820 RepID=U2QK93_9BACL|nr:hypothetical protein [Gemella bergeri]ERK56901.1 hypothetical protein HMPREF1983_01281 [Gemella bergeri ATCC 700627]
MLFAIAEAPLFVILGLIAFIFSFTVYSIVAFSGVPRVIDVRSSVKFSGITILA